jgi:peptidoglycan hydrolase CwlO-like protein
VWTNENLSDATGTVSVVGDPRNAAKGKASSDKAADPHYVSEVKKQLEKLQTEISAIDKELVDLKNFSKGEPSSSSSGMQLHKSYDRDPVEVQIRELQGKKTDLQSRIDALLDEARKKNVEPGQLR